MDEFFYPGSALNPVRYIYIIKPDLFTGILSVLTPNQLSPLNPRFLKTRFHCKYLLRAEKPQSIFGTTNLTFIMELLFRPSAWKKEVIFKDS